MSFGELDRLAETGFKVPASIRIYIEGDKKLLPGFRQFLNQFYNRGSRIDLAMCGPNVIGDFANGIRKFPDSINVLLMDSEGPFTSDLIQSVRTHDRWDPSSNYSVPDESLNFMVQVMESWFLADMQALSAYYGRAFSANRLPANSAVEEIPKDDVLSGLAGATRATTKGRYHKTNHGPRLLEAIDPDKVCAAAPNCSRLFYFLNSLVSQSP